MEDNQGRSPWWVDLVAVPIIFVICLTRFLRGKGWTLEDKEPDDE